MYLIVFCSQHELLDITKLNIVVGFNVLKEIVKIEKKLRVYSELPQIRMMVDEFEQDLHERYSDLE